MSTMFLVTSEFNDSCNCHPEYEYERIGLFSSEVKADAWILAAPQTIMSRGISRNLNYNIVEISVID